MAITSVQHVEQHNGDYYLVGSRVKLKSVVLSWLRGDGQPEAVQRAFPSLSLATIYGAISFYLDHQTMLDTHFEQDQIDFVRQRQDNINSDPEFFQHWNERVAAWRATHRRRVDDEGKPLSGNENQGNHNGETKQP